MLVRPIAPEDREQLIKIIIKQKNFLQCEIDTATEVIDETFNPAEDYQALAAFDKDSNLLGFISFGPIPLTVNRFDIYWIAVDPDCGRQGTGTVLLREMEQKLTQAGNGHIYVETSSTQGYLAARLFYEKNNYELVCQMKDFYRAGDDRLIYRKIY
ncbi:MAG: N-acetyltransferase [Desulfocapsaceae bacterium]|jgi:ribosomal protein S18 acetylase RimI-like enzyme|nr:N-acetyltransferase [Desulfocapsaceae bacterium]